MSTVAVNAGNEDRVGSAGASHMLVNPWARSAAMGDAGIASVNGLEATFTNVAGLAFTDKTQIKFNYSNWMGQAGISLNSAGIAQRISENDVISVSVQSMNFGEIPITTTEVPDVVNGVATLGTYKPQFMNIGLSYAKKFSDAIQGGMGVTIISEAIPNAKAQGVALDAGIQYVTGPKDNIHFGISLRNVGTPMQFRGDGLSFSNEIIFSFNDHNLCW